MTPKKTPPKKDETLETFQEIYNLFMLEHEPDLVTDVVEALDELYVGETPEERTVRYDRYAKALELFQERYKDFVELLHASIHIYKKDFVKQSEKKSNTNESRIMKNIEDSFDNKWWCSHVTSGSIRRMNTA